MEEHRRPGSEARVEPDAARKFAQAKRHWTLRTRVHSDGCTYCTRTRKTPFRTLCMERAVCMDWNGGPGKEESDRPKRRGNPHFGFDSPRGELSSESEGGSSRDVRVPSRDGGCSPYPDSLPSRLSLPPPIPQVAPKVRTGSSLSLGTFSSSSQLWLAVAWSSLPPRLSFRIKVIAC